MAVASRLDYGNGFPEMSENTWASSPNLDLGSLSGLFRVGNSSLNQIFGVYAFHLDRDNPLNFENLNFETIDDGSKNDPIVYFALWIVVSIIFMICGLVWCVCCNKCCCCCTTSYKDGQSTDDFESHNKKFGKPASTRVIVVSIIMALWLITYLIIIGYTFASNDKDRHVATTNSHFKVTWYVVCEKTKGTFDLIETGVDNTVKDLSNYLFTSTRQLAFTFVDEFLENLSPKILQSVVDMQCGDDVDPDQCEEMKEELRDQLKNPLGETGDKLNLTSTSLSNALKEVQDEVNNTRTTLGTDFEDVMISINNALYAVFMILNLIYLLIFLLVLVGTVLATFSKRRSMKIKGHLITRWAIVLMFIFFAICVAQFLIMFVFSGLLTEILCPAIRELEEEPSTTLESSNSTSLVKLQNTNNYQIPRYDKILRACRDDESAYSAFNLENAYNIDSFHETIMKLFDKLAVPNTSAFSNVVKNGTIKQSGKSPEDTIKDIKAHVSNFSEFAAKMVKKDIGKCFPAYNAINSTITLFCYKIPAPVTGFWWILQFVPAMFFLIIATALIFERVQT